MWTMDGAVAGCLCMVVLSSCYYCEPFIANDVITRPERPKSFGSPKELTTYLEQLSQYYAVAGRPRFGKRTMTKSNDKPVLREVIDFRYPNDFLPEASDLYDLSQVYEFEEE